MAQDFSKAFYSSKLWKNFRKHYVESVNGLCEICLQSGVVKSGIELHHIEPLTADNINDVSVTLNSDNVIFLCKDCHSMQHSSRIVPKRYSVDKLTGKVSVV